MAYQTRRNQNNFYRWFFIALFMLCALFCLTVVAIDTFTGIHLLMIESDIDKQALNSIFLVLSLLCIIVSGTILYLMKERRTGIDDRRQYQSPIDFADRRNNDCRRS